MNDDAYRLENTNDALERRVTRLESVVAAMSDTHLMEDRVADRVAERLKQDKNPSDELPRTAMFPAPPKPRGWVVLELWGEVQTFFRMLSDHRFPFSFAMRFGPLVLLLTYVATYGLFNGLLGCLPWIVGEVMERIVDVVLVIMLYKIVSREIERYRMYFPNR